MKLIQLTLLLSILALSVPLSAVGQMKGLSLGGPRLSASPTPTSTPAMPSALVQPPIVHKKPIPLAVKIGIVAFIFLAGLVSLALALRAWSTSNLFDRQYRFPPDPNPALRFGATKSGGCMATIAFHDDTAVDVDLTSEDS